MQLTFLDSLQERLNLTGRSGTKNDITDLLEKLEINGDTSFNNALAILEDSAVPLYDQSLHFKEEEYYNCPSNGSCGYNVIDFADQFWSMGHNSWAKFRPEYRATETICRQIIQRLDTSSLSPDLISLKKKLSQVLTIVLASGGNSVPRKLWLTNFEIINYLEFLPNVFGSPKPFSFFEYDMERKKYNLAYQDKASSSKSIHSLVNMQEWARFFDPDRILFVRKAEHFYCWKQAMQHTGPMNLHAVWAAWYRLSFIDEKRPLLATNQKSLEFYRRCGR